MKTKPMVSQEALEEIYTGFQLCLMQSPEGCGATDVWRELFKDKHSRSYVDNAIRKLRESGHIRFVGKFGKSCRFVLTDKRFDFMAKPVSFAAERAVVDHEPLFALDEPHKPNGWIEDLNKVIAGLELLQAAIPRPQSRAAGPHQEPGAAGEGQGDRRRRGQGGQEERMKGLNWFRPGKEATITFLPNNKIRTTPFLHRRIGTQFFNCLWPSCPICMWEWREYFRNALERLEANT